MNRIRQIAALGQAIWVDFISRELIHSGQLRALVDEGITGVTSNPSIFQKAITSGTAYQSDIRRLSRAGHSAMEIYETLVFQDIMQAADILRSVYNETHGRDGFVSIEVNPRLAHDTQGTIDEARRLFDALHRPNVMIKVPATPAGIPAVETLLADGINVNVTLIFGVGMYEQVMQAYLAGLRRLHERRKPLPLTSSVASFFVSRVDTAVDARISERSEAGDDKLDSLLGQAAIANARVAYARYRAVFESDAFAELRRLGARVQRPLWASTSTKNPEYADTMYIDTLIGPNTVNTVPLNTLEAIRDHGLAAQTIEQEPYRAFEVLDQLDRSGIRIGEVTEQLMHDGVRLFTESFEQLLNSLEEQRQAALAQPVG